MASSGEVVIIFTDTNIGTHIAMAVSPDITAADFKREVERKHLSFFPKLGEIEAHGLMVRRKRRLYHLTESLPAIKYAFQGLKGTWFLHVEVQPSNNLDKSAKTHYHVSEGSNGNSSELNSMSVDTQLEKPLKGKRDYSSPGNSDNKLERTAVVGRRILIAANNIKLSGKKKRPVISSYRFRVATNVPSVSRISAFEMSNSDD